MEMFAFGEPLDITTRHPSPWHQLSHSLSPSALPSHSPSPRRTSSNGSLALANWDQQLSERTGDVRRSQLVLSSGSTNDDASNTNTSDGDVPRTPKLEAERDKEGHIEYKLKLIDPCPERFERLVTQMKWRLSQGGNEAIYEIGLADDGSVIGLTRAEMDASLRTLELMASELGATVMILQEIVIVSPCRRVDLYADGLPKRGTKAVVGEGVLEHVSLPRVKAQKKVKLGAACDSGQPRSKRVDKDAKYQGKMRRRTAIAEAKAEQHNPFILDFGDGFDDALPIEYGWAARKQRQATASAPSLHTPGKVKRNDARRQRAQARRERRHADLLAGDGCTPNPDDSWLCSIEHDDDSATESVDALTSANLHALTHSRAGLHSLSLGQADPTRSSSLRLLASPVGSPPLDDLLTAPLDSVSLSFADVRTVTGDDAKSEIDESVIRPLPGEEMICVEALVIRKGQQEDYVDFDWYQHESGSELRSSVTEEDQ